MPFVSRWAVHQALIEEETTQKPRRHNCLRGFCTRFDQNDKPGYVWSDHLSSPDVATRLKRPTRKPAGNRMLSVRSCFGWGLHSLLCYQTSGSLLHCLFTLTLAGGYFLLHFPGSHLHRTLSGILPYEARTFLTCSLSAFAAAIVCATHYRSILSCRKKNVNTYFPAHRFPTDFNQANSYSQISSSSIT